MELQPSGVRIPPGPPRPPAPPAAGFPDSPLPFVRRVPPRPRPRPPRTTLRALARDVVAELRKVVFPRPASALRHSGVVALGLSAAAAALLAVDVASAGGVTRLVR